MKHLVEEHMFRRELLTAIVLAATPVSALAQSADRPRCDRLAAFYDRYAVPVGEGRTQPAGHLERELGRQECRNGNHAAGVRLLEEAIRRIGYKVPAG